MDKPVPLITINNDGKFQVEKNALEMLRKIKGKIGVVTVAGLYRTGKSYLLNRLLDRQSGFEIGSTVNSQTKGIYIWGAPLEVTHEGEQMKVIVVDTEGIGSLEKDETFITQLSHHIQSKSGDSSEIFPAFMWVLRDFTLDLVDKSGHAITSKQYLENALTPVQEKVGSDGRVKTKNDVRKTIAQFFRVRDCITLIRPTIEERDLKHIDKIPYQNLRTDFKKQMESLRNQVLTSVPFKTIMGRKINGEEFGIMSKAYVEAINKGAIPDIKSAWENIGLVENPRVVEESYKQYVEHMKKKTDKESFPMPDESLEAIHRSSEQDSVSLFNSRKIGDNVEPYLKDLKDKIYAEFVKYQGINRQKSIETCKTIFDSLSKKVDDKVSQAAYKDVTDLLHDLESLHTSYATTAKNQKVPQLSAQAEFFNLAPRFWSSVITRTSKYLLREQEQKYAKLQQQLGELQKTYDQVRSEKETALLDKVKLESLKVQLEKEVASLNASIKDLQNKLVQVNAEKTSLEASLKQGQAERVALEKKLVEEKEANTNAIKEMKRQYKAEKEQLTSGHEKTRKDFETKIAKLGEEQTTLTSNYTIQVRKLETEISTLQRKFEDTVSRGEQERDSQSKQAKQERERLNAELAKEREKFTSEISQVKKEKDNYNSELAKEKAELNREKAEREGVASALAKEKKQREKLAAELERLTGEKDSSQKRVAELQKESATSVEVLQREISSLKKKLESEVDARKKEMEERKKETEERKKEAEERKKETEEKEQAAKKASSLTKSMKKETAELKKRLEEEEEARKKAQEERAALMNNFEGKGKELEQEIQEWRQKWEQGVEETKKARKERAEVADSLEEKTRELEELQKKLKDESKKISGEKKQWKDECEKLKLDLDKALQESDTKCKVYQSETEKLGKQIEDLTNANAQLKTATKSKPVPSFSSNNNNNNNDESEYQVEDNQPDVKKRKRSSIFQGATPKPQEKKVKGAKEAKEEKIKPSKKAKVEWPDPTTLTITELKRQLTKWNVILPAQAEKKTVYVGLYNNHLAANPDQEMDD